MGSSSTTFRHMIDQTPTSSTGTAPSDSFNPQSFVLTSKRDSVTQGYKNATGSYSGPYTIMKALADVNSRRKSVAESGLHSMQKPGI